MRHHHTDEHGHIQHAQSKVAKHMRGKHGEGKMEKVMHEWKHGKLHSGSKHGPEVHSRAQAVAIGMSEARKAAHGHKKHGKHHRRHK